jgi:hypothetical protein
MTGSSGGFGRVLLKGTMLFLGLLALVGVLLGAVILCFLMACSAGVFR